MNDEDRLLLERAAEAAGIFLRWHEPEVDEDGVEDFMDATWCYIPSAKPPHDRRKSDKTSGVIWNPLESNDDALCLLARLQLQIEHYNDSVFALTDIPPWHRAEEPVKSDRAAALRRAITRCAAAMAPSANPQEPK